MKRTFTFGKIAYNTSGIKRNLVTVDVELKDRQHEGKTTPEFSACGEIWNSRGTDVVSAGQNLDTIREYIHTPLFKEIYDLWQHWHLNCMSPSCSHQKKLGWDELAKKPVKLYHWTLDPRVRRRQRNIQNTALDALKRGETATLNAEQVRIENLEYEIITDKDELSESLARFYVPCKPLFSGDRGHEETKTLGWLRPSEHPDGILARPCPVCGYKYGTKWLEDPIPERDLRRIRSLIENGEVYKENE